MGNEVQMYGKVLNLLVSRLAKLHYNLFMLYRYHIKSMHVYTMLWTLHSNFTHDKYEHNYSTSRDTVQKSY